LRVNIGVRVKKRIELSDIRRSAALSLRLLCLQILRDSAECEQCAAQDHGSTFVSSEQSHFY
jgi:hypothetical protein